MKLTSEEREFVLYHRRYAARVRRAEAFRRKKPRGNPNVVITLGSLVARSANGTNPKPFTPAQKSGNL